MLKLEIVGSLTSMTPSYEDRLLDRIKDYLDFDIVERSVELWSTIISSTFFF